MIDAEEWFDEKRNCWRVIANLYYLPLSRSMYMALPDGWRNLEKLKTR